jgi:hypothetical protein
MSPWNVTSSYSNIFVCNGALHTVIGCNRANLKEKEMFDEFPNCLSREEKGS